MLDRIVRPCSRPFMGCTCKDPCNTVQYSAALAGPMFKHAHPLTSIHHIWASQTLSLETSGQTCHWRIAMRQFSRCFKGIFNDWQLKYAEMLRPAIARGGEFAWQHVTTFGRSNLLRFRPSPLPDGCRDCGFVVHEYPEQLSEAWTISMFKDGCRLARLWPPKKMELEYYPSLIEHGNGYPLRMEFLMSKSRTNCWIVCCHVWLLKSKRWSFDICWGHDWLLEE